MRTIDLSAGDEQRLSVLVAGWPQSKKELYAGALESIDGVTTVTSAGGGTSFYVYFDPDVVHVDELERTVHDIGQAVRSDATGGLTADSDIETADSEVLTFDGEPLTFDGEPLTFPVNRSSNEYDRTRPTEDVGGRLPDTGETLLTEGGEAIALEDGHTHIHTEGALAAAPIGAAPLGGGVPRSIPVEPSTWTGIRSGRERAMAVRTMVPIALGAIDTLLLDVDRLGHNNGPPLSDREEAIESLRGLHGALSELLALVDRPGYLDDAGEGALVEVASWGIRACEAMKQDPMRYAMSGLIFAICAGLGAPGAGGLLGSMALTVCKKAHGAPDD